MNFRKFFCKALGWVKFIYNVCDCQRYEPTPPPEYVTVKICEPCGKVAVAGCFTVGVVVDREYLKGTEPTEKCTPSKCCKIIVPPQKHVLIKEKQYSPGRKGLSPCLIPSIGFNKVMTDKNVEDFADRFAAEGWGNFIRMFVAGNWEPEWQDKEMMSMPYMRVGSTFTLRYKDDAHFESIWRRGSYFIERGIMPMLSLLDNCSLKTREPGHWKTHWMNGDNNINSTSNKVSSQTHWYEYNGLPPYSSPEDEEPGMKNTGEFLMDLYGHVLESAKRYWGDFFLVEIGNEIDARNEYHDFMRTFINHTLNQGDLDGRVFTSMEHDWFYASKMINKKCIPIIHKVGDYAEYQERVKLVNGMRHGASQDGRPPLATAKETKETVLDILKSDSVLYEGNLRPIEWPKICGGSTWTLKDLKWDLFRAYGTAFSEYLLWREAA